MKLTQEHKYFAAGCLAMYLIWAAVAGLAMKQTIPALNGLGVVYTGLTFPVALGCTATGSKCTAVPPQRYAQYLFNRKAERHQ